MKKKISKNIRFIKEKLSVENIGQLRFWIGIISGLISATAISLMFNYSREVFRFLTSISDNLLILEEHELVFTIFFLIFLLLY